ncbi:MltR family transcriptional regulator [Providencia vermicola]|uniref:MltR family transcriptional regulator n=2 Tax=Providencia TaxID=586 RepID=A0AAI9HWA2_PROST|nr:MULTISPECIES: MltR family transcriptional regulator [Providencia]ELR5045096.1 MltR family transcriptional regulator [Providencia rettgeri]ELR5034157.1 MltR family transcriptional regulator [Providencia stuartii]ELR5119467.1 MltR family transcriptional regulator [Providencia stuartii]ELR5141204.1 MltR family transcriptional regulator [Providencia stuartii]ELR5290582.1 MltR family transcriptional regulator [Providencia stuartii]
MENRQYTENQVLERLNKHSDIRPFIQEVIVLITEAIDQLMLKVFRKDDYAVKYAVEPLLEGNGPLGKLSVRLKLLFALGAISRELYEDIELFLALNEVLSTEQLPLAFTDDEIIGPIKTLHCIDPLPEMMLFNLPEDLIDQQLIDLQKYRYQEMVKSALVLSVTSLISQILDTEVF